jgi:hypothetical protein
MTPNLKFDNNCRLDLSRLEKVCHRDSRITARCPACAENGNDRRGNHLAIWPSGKFSCAAMSDDAEHRRRIFALAGVAGDWTQDPALSRRWREIRAKQRQDAESKKRLTIAAKMRRAAIVARHEWDPSAVWEDSPQRIDCQLVETDPRHFLASMFPSDSVLWTGETHESGQDGRHSNRWRTCQNWMSAPNGERIGPMVTPAIWNAGTVSRSAANVMAGPYVILDFDGFDGIKPETPDQIRTHIEASLALIRWLREGLSWQLAAIVWTGGKSLHAWFHAPSNEILQTLKIVASDLGIDAGLIGRPEHPCRLPGHPHNKTGHLSRVLWLQTPTF